MKKPSVENELFSDVLAIYQQQHAEIEMANSLDLYATVLSAIHNPENDQVWMVF